MGIGDLDGRFVGPMPIEDMLELLPVIDPKIKSIPHFAEDCFSTLDVQDEKKEMYDPFIQRVTASQTMPGFQLVNVSKGSGGSSEGLVPDVVAHRRPESVAVPRNSIDYMDLELVFEFRTKQARADPFDSRATKTTEKAGPKYPFEARRDAKKVCRTQISHYARKWLSAQHRTHCFIVYIGDPYARIIRFDRAGALVSERFDYRIDGDLLLEFLWRYSQTTDEARGRDTTVRTLPLDDENVKLAQCKLQEWKPRNDSIAVLAMDIPTNVAEQTSADSSGSVPGTETDSSVEAACGMVHTVYVWGALSEPDTVTGRATRGYPAWDPSRPEGKDIVFVKDSWRSCGPDMEKETDTLQTLNKHGVRNVPEYLYGDDIPGHKTITQDYTTAEWNVGDVAKDFVTRVHIRFVEDVVGLPLWEFETPKQLVEAIHDAVIGHQDAYERCGILHRDVSLGNILRRRGAKGGVLNDWDLAARYHIETHTPLKDKRHQSRTGTWQFMSIRLLTNPLKVHHCIDDTESFVWTLLYCAMRYMKTSIAPIQLQATMEDIFDQVDRHVPGESNTGGAGKLLFVTFGISSYRDFIVDNNEPLTKLIATLFRKIVYKFRNRVWESHDNIEELIEEHQCTREQAQENVDRETDKLAVQLYQLMESTLKDSLDKDWPRNFPGWHDYLIPPKTEKAMKHPRSPVPNGESDNAVDTAFSSNLDGFPSVVPRKKKRLHDYAPDLPPGLSALVGPVRQSQPSTD